MAKQTIADGKADLVAFGRPFISNPDLVRRLPEAAPLNELKADKPYGGGAEGYTDYPFLPDCHLYRYSTLRHASLHLIPEFLMIGSGLAMLLLLS